VIDAFCSQAKLFFIAHPLPALSKCHCHQLLRESLLQVSWAAAALWWQGAQNGRRKQLTDKWVANQTNSPITRTIKKIPFLFFFFSTCLSCISCLGVGEWGMSLEKVMASCGLSKQTQSPHPIFFLKPVMLIQLNSCQITTDLTGTKKDN
jgi:hypothetical protein